MTVFATGMGSVGMALSLVVLFTQLGSLPLAIVTLTGSNFIREVQTTGWYFDQAMSAYYSSFSYSGELDGLGVLKYRERPGGHTRSNPLFVLEMLEGAGLLCLGIVLGLAGFILVTFQLLGVKSTSRALNLCVFWAILLQFVCILAGGIVLTVFMKQTFDYRRFGAANHCCWAAMATALVSAVVAFIRVMVVKEVEEPKAVIYRDTIPHQPMRGDKWQEPMRDEPRYPIAQISNPNFQPIKGGHGQPMGGDRIQSLRDERGQPMRDERSQPMRDERSQPMSGGYRRPLSGGFDRLPSNPDAHSSSPLSGTGSSHTEMFA